MNGATRMHHSQVQHAQDARTKSGRENNRRRTHLYYGSLVLNTADELRIIYAVISIKLCTKAAVVMLACTKRILAPPDARAPRSTISLIARLDKRERQSFIPFGQ